MKILFALTCLLLLWINPLHALNDVVSHHLLTRTGFSSDPHLSTAIKHLKYEQAVDYLLNHTHKVAQSLAPTFDNLNPDNIPYKTLSLQQKQMIRRQMRQQIKSLQAWWIKEMITTESPLTEAMTLFWHNHFTSSAKKVKHPKLMLQQNELLRLHATGNFRQLLQAIAKDPAMVIYLDNHKNKKGSPNENFAREVMELFTLGEGYYTENDIKQAAIAFTGWRVNRKKGRFQFSKKNHDSQAITVLGKNISTTNLRSGEQVLEALLEHPQTAIYLSTKLYKHFISYDRLDQDTILFLADTLRHHNYDIKPWLKALLLSKAFKQEQQKGSLIKSPIDLIVGTFRTLSLAVDDAKQLAKASAKMGQELFNPPNVKGWPGGTNWITTHSFLIRRNTINKIMREKNMTNIMSAQMKNPVKLLAIQYDKAMSIKQQLLDPAYQVK